MEGASPLRIKHCIIDLGVEKVAVSAATITNPDLLTQIIYNRRQSVIAVLDIKEKNRLFSSGYEICSHNGKILHKANPFMLARSLQDAGAGRCH